ncbi:MAG TPA: hypothetical protein VF427_01705 [Noviherbaspirillum sp.]
MVCRRPLDYCPALCGNPVSHTGVKIQPELDYLSADGLLEYRRTYSSAGLPKPGWTHSYQDRIDFDGTVARVTRASAAHLYFKADGSNFIPIQPTTAKLSISGGNFILQTEDDRTETYSASGELQRITFRDGKTIDITRAFMGGNLIVTVTDLYGRQIVAQYKPAEWLNFSPQTAEDLSLQTVQLPDGSTINYSNSKTAGILETVRYPDGAVRSYQYGSDIAALKLIGIIDENGINYASFKYSSGYSGGAGWLDTVTQHAGTVERYEISDVGGRASTGAGTVTVTDPRGTASTHLYALINGISRLVSTTRNYGASSSMTYDSNGNVASRTDFKGNLTRYSYDQARNLETSRTEGLTSAGAATSATRTIDTTWHPAFNLPTRIVEKDATGTAVRQTDIAYDDKGNKTSQSVKDLATNATRTTTWTYTYSSTVPGHVERMVIDGPRNDVQDITIIDYWPADAACDGNGPGQDKGCRGQIKTITDALGNVTRYTAYDANSRPLSIVDSNGLVTNLTYSLRGRLTSKTVGSETTAYDYDGVGQLKKVTLPDGSTIGYTYDDAHRLTDVADSLGNSIHYTLDVMGNRIKEEVKDPAGALTRRITRVYDALNRLQQITGGLQ